VSNPSLIDAAMVASACVASFGHSARRFWDSRLPADTKTIASLSSATCDTHFEGLPGVTLIEKIKG
jgi:hypothetical protein